MSNIRCQVVSTSGAFGVPGAEIPPEPNPTSSLYVAPSIFQGRFFSITLNFQVNNGTVELPEWANVDGVFALSLPSGITIVNNSNSSVTVFGPHINAFPDETFDFCMYPDYRRQTLPLINAEDYLALTRWNLPSSMVINRDILLNIRVGSLLSPFTIRQTVGWNFDDTAPTFREVLAGR